MTRTAALGAPALFGFVWVWLLAPAAAADDPYKEGYVGPDKCAQCHHAETEVWKKTKHFLGYARLHKMDRTAAILEVVEGKGSPRRNWTCTLCHYTMVSTRGRRARARAGVSCESCHGAAEKWIDIHWDPGPYRTNSKEPPEHKRERLAKARELGMINSSMDYDLASRCFRCHGLARDDLPAEKLARMLEAGHPLKPDFEFVAYSQGSVRHHLDGTTERLKTPLELARLFVIGAAAELVSASKAAGAIDQPKYAAAQKARADDARRVLTAIARLPEAKALLANPTEENARKLVAVVRTADVLKEVEPLLPSRANYK